jgi:hypothetical protein
VDTVIYSADDKAGKCIPAKDLQTKFLTGGMG